jgi:iron complex outermembrane receptor protein
MAKVTDADFSGIDLINANRTQEASSSSQEIRFASNMIGNWEYLLGFYNYESDLREFNDNAVSVGADWTSANTAVLNGFYAQTGTTAQSINQLRQIPAANLSPQQAELLAKATGLQGLVMLAVPGDRIEQDMSWSTSMQALFGTATNHLSDSLRLSLGLRYADEDRDADLYAQTYLVGTMAAPATLAAMLPGVETGDTVPRQMTASQWRLNAFLNNVDDTFARNTTSSTYSVSLQKDLQEDVMVYVSYSTGFKSGGFNATGEDEALGYAREYKDEDSVNFEVGLKSIINNGKTKLNATIFNMETENLQGVKQLDSGTGTVVYNSSVPAKRLGLDLNLVTKITPNLVLNFGYMKLDDDDADISTNAAIRLTPKMAYNVGLSHFIPLYNGRIHSRIDYSYDDEMEVTSNYSTSPALAPLPDSYKEMRDRRNLNIKIAWSNENLEVAYWIKNATDDVYERLVTAPSPVAGGNFAVFMMKPKTQGFSIKYNF